MTTKTRKQVISEKCWVDGYTSWGISNFADMLSFYINPKTTHIPENTAQGGISFWRMRANHVVLINKTGLEKKGVFEEKD